MCLESPLPTACFRCTARTACPQPGNRQPPPPGASNMWGDCRSIVEKLVRWALMLRASSRILSSVLLLGDADIVSDLNGPPPLEHVRFLALEALLSCGPYPGFDRASGDMEAAHFGQTASRGPAPAACLNSTADVQTCQGQPPAVFHQAGGNGLSPRGISGGLLNPDLHPLSA